MPRTADRTLFAAHRALARALARLAPIYRQRLVAVVGRALADDMSSGALELIGMLDAAELSQAHRLAIAAREQREAALIERQLARWFVAVKAFSRRLTSPVWRRLTRNT